MLRPSKLKSKNKIELMCLQNIKSSKMKKIKQRKSNRGYALELSMKNGLQSFQVFLFSENQCTIVARLTFQEIC